MGPDFSGWATKVGLECSDGRTIMPDAFKHQDQMKVPLVWQHSHDTPENVLGHVMLENRDEGVYCKAFFNDSPQARAAKESVKHGDINQLSIWANKLLERSKRVMHGTIREVSLVLSGANPGALIDTITIAHGDGTSTTLDDEAIIYTGLTLEHADGASEADTATDASSDTEDDGMDDKTVQDVVETMDEEQQQALSYLVGEALAAGASEGSSDDDEEADEAAQHSDTTNEGEIVMGNVFDQAGDATGATSISHDDMKEIVATAKRTGSLKHAMEDWAGEHLEHGIDDIEVLFPEARMVTDSPEFISRRMEWVNKVLGPARKTPFARIKTMAADITMDEARAKGYIKGEMKREEFFGVTKRETTPQTVYKKQKLDRDDIIDITEFDVVIWLKSEMRVMLDEELARAALIGDGRDIAHADKISESHVRPIANEHELFATTVYVNMSGSTTLQEQLVDVLVANRSKYKGSGLPTLFTSESIISSAMLLKDAVGRRIYKDLSELANELRVSEIVPVEAFEEETEVVAILVNMVDYTFGTDKGGELNFFDDFDIDYNQYTYLYETRLSGALTRLKSAIVVKKTDDANVLVSPTAPAFDEEAGEVTITNTTGVVYTDADDVVINAAGSPYAVAEGETYVVNAAPAAGYYFASSDGDQWSFTNRP